MCVTTPKAPVPPLLPERGLLLKRSGVSPVDRVPLGSPDRWYGLREICSSAPEIPPSHADLPGPVSSLPIVEGWRGISVRRSPLCPVLFREPWTRRRPWTHELLSRASRLIASVQPPAYRVTCGIDDTASRQCTDKQFRIRHVFVDCPECGNLLLLVLTGAGGAPDVHHDLGLRSAPCVTGVLHRSGLGSWCRSNSESVDIDLSARRMAARFGQHALSIHIRKDCGGCPGIPSVPGLLPWRGCGGEPGSGADQSHVVCTRSGGERSHSGDLGSIPALVSESGRPSAGPYLHLHSSGYVASGSGSGILVCDPAVSGDHVFGGWAGWSWWSGFLGTRCRIHSGDASGDSREKACG